MKNLDLSSHSQAMYDSAKAAHDKIVAFMKENNVLYINLQQSVTGADEFFSYGFPNFNDQLSVTEQRIIAISVVDSIIHTLSVPLGDEHTYSKDEIECMGVDLWQPMFGGENYGVFEMFWFGEFFGELDLEDENIVVKRT